jgi:hypothetical protein
MPWHALLVADQYVETREVLDSNPPAHRPSSVKFPGLFSHMFDRKMKKKKIIEAKRREK